ncbi:50S ribosomal protein L9 [Buchnera aphidicola (Cinara kochiana kochiana)]|uniref:Large ribosomal subunit protein bL9 n=1 Tax=Buchnera aphidicola (Cinara kochiana kochiana) TaxID=2518976 RepID=A0A451D668_9GAMM|nr:50S ribosomal protein L9 [Buchnera aphidicola]VFP81273.1 50S ribosomal protein L9 [Buchnera aphidicola (Cinara kochiana kochiana)]
MKVILINSTEKLGKKGQLISVKNGYARNYLIPMKKALLATSKNIKIFKQTRIIAEKQKSEKINQAKNRINSIKLIGAMIFFVKSSKKNKIFGSIGIRDIVKNLLLMGIIVEKHEIKLPQGLLRYLGTHTVFFTPYKNMDTEIQVSILSK